ncbi:hypothetical protein HZC07_01665 [Candidatus Micrarchaeota archaeon]|nr:hypothetical protein [Candidatus Micrarchaeota archaeon]
MRFFWIIVFAMLLATSSYAGFVYGEIYQSNLERVNKTIIKVDGSFSYQQVTNKGNYSFFLPDGSYNISASVLDGDGNAILYVNEPIKVGKEDQKLDLVLKPINKNDTNSIVLVVFVILVIIVAGLIFFLFNTKKSEKNEHGIPAKEAGTEVKKQTHELDPDAKKVLEIVHGDQRITQKELREIVNFSDAKLSLILGELESIGEIKKFKRGRGNIIKKT